MSKVFPDGFLWGAATSAYQVEGGIENNDWAEAARQGKIPAAGKASDHYVQFEEDFDIAKKLGHNAHRFSIEWARIEPEEGVFDEKELAHYRSVVIALRARGMEPFVTLWHFTLPQWFAESGGFGRKDASEIFARYVERVVEVLGDEVQYFITMNEPMVWIGGGNVQGIWPPFRKNYLAFFALFGVLVRVHRRAYRVIKERAPHAKVGIAKNNIPFEGRGIIGTIVAPFAQWFWNRRFLNAIRHAQDFIGLNHYFRVVLWPSKEEEAAMPRSDFGWELYPPALYTCLKELRRYRVPIFVTENGLADANDSRREQFIVDSLAEVHRAIEDGVPVKGYMHWSLMDNFEWAEGFKMRFGLIEVAYDRGCIRTVRRSARAYAEVCKNNSL